jgi:hypothetical protein
VLEGNYFHNNVQQAVLRRLSAADRPRSPVRTQSRGGPPPDDHLAEVGAPR